MKEIITKILDDSDAAFSAAILLTLSIIGIGVIVGGSYHIINKILG